MNTIIAQLGRTASRWQYSFLKQFGFKVFHEPIGGWEEHQFDKDLSWNHYLNTRMSCRPSNSDDPVVIGKYNCMDLRDVITSGEYIEVGFASMPFIESVPFDWRLLGVVRHPQTWIYSASYFNFYKHHISWKPEGLYDYARIWNEYNRSILKQASRTYRIEDFKDHSEMFVQEFGYYKKLLPEQLMPHSDIMEDIRVKDFQDKVANFDDGSWWEIVEELADELDYTYMPDYLPSIQGKEGMERTVASSGATHIPANEIKI